MNEQKVGGLTVTMRYQLLRIMIGLGLIATAAVPALADAATTRRDCTSNSIMYCGAYTKTEFLQKYDSGDTKHSAQALDALYTQKGISRAEFASADTVAGTVTKSGNVIVNGKTVATDAVSWGRDPISGSTKDGNLYQSSNETAFLSSSLPAFVYMPNGVFQWAVLEPCGNMVAATHVPIVTKTVTKVVPQPVVQTVTKTVEVPVPTPVVETKMVQLPDTGPTAPLLAAGGLSIVSATAWMYRRSKRDLVDSLRSSI